MRHAMGVAVFSGMLGVTFFGLILTPVFYLLVRRLKRRTAPRALPQVGLGKGAERPYAGRPCAAVSDEAGLARSTPFQDDGRADRTPASKSSRKKSRRAFREDRDAHA